MQMPFLWLFTHLLVFRCLSSLPAQFIKVHDLQSIIHPHGHPIFNPVYSSNSGKEAEHNIHMTDNLGKFYKLNYKFKIQNHFNVIHLDNIPIEDVECGNNTDMINITFQNSQDA
eukprot:362796_1